MMETYAFRIDLTNVSATVRSLVLVPVKFFSKLNLFLDALTQQIIFLIIQINNFWGDLSGISAKPATLTGTDYRVRMRRMTTSSHLSGLSSTTS